MAQARTWRSEHGEDYAVPKEIEALVASGWLTDESWHNDACPSFTRYYPEIGEQTNIRLWVDHPDPGQREVQFLRFALSIEPLCYAERGREEVIATEDLPELLRTMIWTDRMITSRFREMKQLRGNGKLPRTVSSWADVHNFCDANVLGDAEALMEVATSAFDTPEDIGEKAINWFAGILNPVDSLLDWWLNENSAADELPQDLLQLARLVPSKNPTVEERVVAHVRALNDSDQRRFAAACEDGGWQNHRLIALMQAAYRLGAKEQR